MPLYWPEPGLSSLIPYVNVPGGTKEAMAFETYGHGVEEGDGHAAAI